MAWIGILFVVFLFYIFNLLLRRTSVKTEAKKYDELLRFFAPGEKIKVPDINEKIQARTEGRRNLADAYLYKAFDELCEEGKLGKETTVINLGGRNINSTVYFLLEKN